MTIEEIKDKISSGIGYSFEECLSIRFAFKVYPETVNEFKELLNEVADVEVFDKGNKQILLITPKQ
jgi:hypothetical protein